MAKLDKLLLQILSGKADANIRFADLCALMRHLGFTERKRSSHHIFRRPDIEELVNLQRSGSKAKVYQVRQVRAVILKYRLHEPREHD
jgi:predicted RNA binding protein YcfA (HicA-like mRNA interferase family)